MVVYRRLLDAQIHCVKMQNGGSVLAIKRSCTGTQKVTYLNMIQHNETN